MEQMSIYLKRREGSRTVEIEATWQPFDTQALIGKTLRQKVKVPDGIELTEEDLRRLFGLVVEQVMDWSSDSEKHAFRRWQAAPLF